MSSFDISVGGLQAQAAAIAVTSNNVANASTVGYKSRESLFVDQYFKAVQSGGASGAADFGAKRVSTQGTLKGTSSPLDLAVQGQGLFCLSSLVSGDTANSYYSRNGSFSVDKAGYIVNANGLYLTGYQPNATLTGTTPTIAALKMPPPALAPRASTSGQLVANLDARVGTPRLVVGGVTTTTPKTFLASDPSTFNSSTTVDAYDSRGLAHQVSLFFKKVDATVIDDPRSLTTPKAQATGTQYEVYLQADGVTMAATTAGNTGVATLGNAAVTAAAVAQALANTDAVAAATANDKTTLYAGASASLASAVAAHAAAVANGSPAAAVTAALALVGTATTANAAALADKTLADSGAAAAAMLNSAAVAKTRIGTLQFVDGRLVGSLVKMAGTEQPVAPAIYTVDLADDKGAALFSVALDLSDMTAFGDGFLVTKNSADGFAPGDLADVRFDEKGQLTGQYSNGVSLVAGQVVLAGFKNEADLAAASGSVFTETFDSGSPMLGTGTAGFFGVLRSNMLEQSTTDMAAELVNLMIQQRNYQANSQGLQAANTLLTTAINMGR